MLICARSVVPVRNTSLSHIRDALGRSLMKQIDALSDTEKVQAKKELEGFLACFPNVRLGMNEELFFQFNINDNRLSVWRNDREPTSIKSNLIGQLLIKFYLDPKQTSVPEVGYNG